MLKIVWMGSVSKCVCLCVVGGRVAFCFHKMLWLTDGFLLMYDACRCVSMFTQWYSGGWYFFESYVDGCWGGMHLQRTQIFFFICIYSLWIGNLWKTVMLHLTSVREWISDGVLIQEKWFSTSYLFCYCVLLSLINLLYALKVNTISEKVKMLRIMCCYIIRL